MIYSFFLTSNSTIFRMSIRIFFWDNTRLACHNLRSESKNKKLRNQAVSNKCKNVLADLVNFLFIALSLFVCPSLSLPRSLSVSFSHFPVFHLTLSFIHSLSHCLMSNILIIND